MTLRTSLQRLIGRDPVRLTLRERAAETAARFAASKSATDAATADPPPQAGADAVLVEASGDLRRLEATIAAIPSVPDRDLDEAPEYAALEAEAERAVSVIAGTPATGLLGLQAKAAAVLSDRFSVQSPEALEMAQSLARDVLGASPTVIVSRPEIGEDPTDPSFALIEAHQAAFAEYHRLGSGPDAGEMQQSSVELARAEDLAFMRLLGGLPTSLPGLMALADYLPEAIRQRGGDEADDEAVIALGGICASIRTLVAEGKVVAAPGVGPTDWYNPPPGFMASPAIEPTHFAMISHGVRIELERLHRIALAELARRTGPDTSEAVREHLRRVLKIDVFEAASLSGDAEILALGMELDAVHARWRASLPAYNEAQARFSRAEQNAKARGKDVWTASEAVWNEPGVREAMGLFENISAELDPICRKIWSTPARTPLGLAVKARASLVMIFACGEYEAGCAPGADEDLTEQSARHLIEACCAFAGVDWKGEMLDGSQLTVPAASQDRQAPGLVSMVDFASASLEELQSLRDLADQVGGVAYATVWTGRCKGRGGRYNAAGELMQWLGDALTDVETAANDEARRRKPTTRDDRETRLKMLALPVLQNGDPDEIAAFAGELAAHSLAELRGR